MSDILAEIDDVMRQERVERFFKEYGKFVVAAVLAIIVLTAAFSGYKSWNRSVNEKGTAALLALLDTEDFPENMKTATLDMRPGLRGIGLITAAGAFLDEGNEEDALALYGRVAADNSVPADIRSMAVLMQIRLAGSEDAEASLTALEKIWSNSKDPWRHHARLEAAALYAGIQQNYEKAKEHLNAVQDAPGLPESMYDTARALYQVYDTKEKKSAPGSGS